MMTWEEAIVFLSQYIDNDCYTEKCQEAHRMAVTALCPVSREQVEKVWRGCNECTSCKLCIWNETKRCNNCNSMSLFKPVSNFCPKCGRPMTNEAVQMVMERLEALNEM